MRKPLPIGVDNFKKVIKEYYYNDKSMLLKELLDLKGEINLFMSVPGYREKGGYTDRRV